MQAPLHLPRMIARQTRHRVRVRRRATVIAIARSTTAAAAGGGGGGGREVPHDETTQDVRGKVDEECPAVLRRPAGRRHAHEARHRPQEVVNVRSPGGVRCLAISPEEPAHVRAQRETDDGEEGEVRDVERPHRVLVTVRRRHRRRRCRGS